MTTSNITLNQLPNDPSLNDLLNLFKREIFFDLSCHHIGTIQAFNSAKQTVTASVNYTRTFFELNSSTGLYDAVQKNYTPLLDCPAIVLGGGPVNLTMPIAKGDECVLLFNDRDLDNWFSGSTLGPVATSRAHSFSDALALVGVRSLARSISGYDAVRALLTNGTVKLGVNPTNNKVLITNGTSLNTLLQNLSTQLQNLTAACAAITVSGVTGGIGNSGVPVNAAAINTVGTNISNIATQIGGLLE